MVRIVLQANEKKKTIKDISRRFKVVVLPFYKRGRITKDEYKHIMRNAVPTVRHVYTLLI